MGGSHSHVDHEWERREHERREQERRHQEWEEQQRTEERQRQAEEAARQAEEARRSAEEAARRAEEQRRQAEESRRRAEEEARRREEERRRAEEAQRRAEEQARRAEEERRRVEEERRRAEEAARAAEEARRRAEEERQRREREQQEAERARQEAEKAAAEARAQQEAAEKQLRKGARPVIIPSLQQIQEAKERFQYQEGYLHVGVAGIAGSGKSSLVNALRGIRNGEPGAAETGIVETTSVAARYPDPKPGKRIVWYDVPGAGTLSIPDWIYFADQGLFVLDCILVLFDARFTATDIAILRNCERFRIPAYIVRSKARQHIRNLVHDIGGEDSDDEDDGVVSATALAKAREQYVKESRETVSRNLEAAGLPQQRVYLVDKQTLVPLVRGEARGSAEVVDENDLLDALSEESRRKE